MGQALSKVEGRPIAEPLPPQPQHLPLTFSRHNTVVLDAGRLSQDTPRIWHIEGGLLRFPIPAGYSATCTAYSQTAHLSVEPSPVAGVQFVVSTSDGTLFTGSTPTAPFAKWALCDHRVDVVNGMEAFGFAEPEVQALLRCMATDSPATKALVDHPPSQLAETPGAAAVAPWAEGATKEAGTILAHEIMRIAAERTQQPAFSLSPSLKNWLAESSAPAAVAAAPGPQSPLQDTTGRRAGGELPPRPPSRPDELPVEAQAAQLVARPVSRPRSRRPGSSEGGRTGRGWTAFTIFGLEKRDEIRAANPWASAVEIEKMVGRQWAALSPDEKRHYTDVAAEARRASHGTVPGAVEGVALQQVHSTGASPEAINLRRSRSDAASEERSQRPHRRPRHLGPEFDSEDAPWGRRRSFERPGSREHDLEQVYADILVADEAERLGRAKQRAVETVRSSDEEDVLGVLEGMRSEAIAKDTATSGGDEQQKDGSAAVAKGKEKVKAQEEQQAVAAGHSTESAADAES